VKALEGDTIVSAVLEDYRTAPIDEKLRTTLAFLEKLTLAPGSIDVADLVPVRAAGVSDTAIEEAIRVCFLFNTIDRIADALNFQLPTEQSLRWVARILHKVGYWPASVPG
jgi:alkylhydroperoxidase family enzyme